MTVVSRLQLNHPVLGTAGGTGLHASIEALFKKIGDNMDDRFFYLADVADTTIVECEHNFNTTIGNLRYDLYLWNESTQELILLKESTTPKLSQFAIAAKSGSEKTHITLTNNSGAERDLALVVLLEPIDWAAKTGFNKVVGTDYFASLTAANPQSGDRILVLNSYTRSADETLTVDDCEIVFMPGVKIQFNTGTYGLKIAGSRNRLVNPYIYANVNLFSALRIQSGNDNEIRQARVEVNNAGATVDNAFSVAAGNRNFVEGSEWVSAGAITNKISDLGTDTEYSIRGSAA